MCDPVSITLGVTAAALSAGSVAAQISAQNKAAKRSAQSAKEALAADVQQSQIQAEQIQAQTTQETLALKREALQRRGALLAAQSSTGFFGNSPLREELNLRLKESEALGTIEENQATTLLQNQAERGKILATAKGRLNEAASRTTSPFAAALQIGGSGVGGFASGVQLGRSLKVPRKGA
jgi:hypothetical protein